MFEDIRNLYMKALLEEIVKPVLVGLSEEEREEIKSLLISSLHEFETRLKEVLSADASGIETVYTRLSPFEAFKHQFRDMSAYVMHKYRERRSSRITSTASSESSESIGNVPIQALQEYYTPMVEGIQLQGTTLLDELVQESCLDDSDVASIKHKPTDRKRNEQLLHILTTRVSGDAILKKFIPALKTEHAHLATGYMKVYADISPLASQCPHCRLKGKVDPKVMAEKLYSKKLITENELIDFRKNHCWTDEKWEKILSKIPNCSVLIECLKHKYPEFYKELIRENQVNLRECSCNVGRTDLISIISNEDSSSVFESTEKTIENTIPSYPMHSSTRGICVIIHNTDYSQETHGINDILKIEGLFSGFGFTIERITNLTKRHILIRLEEIASRDHSNYDAFVCAIALGGRDRDHVCDVSAESMHIAYLVAPFRARSCPTLAGKPKVFILPYASGSRRTPGLVIKEAMPLSHLETRKTIVPEDADILYARGTMPGYTTSSCKKTGSWYLTNLLDVMERHGDTVDFVSCLAMVNEGVGKVEYTKNDITYTQSSHVTSTLRRALYFKRRSRSGSRSLQEDIAILPNHDGVQL